MTRAQRRVNIILFYLLLLLMIGGVVYFMTRSEMTCNDGIKNQGEEKIDCGGPCKPCVKKIQLENLEIKSIERVDNNKGSEDILIKIYNPNENYGAKSFKYKIYDNESDKGVYSYEGKDFILPKETKYVIVNEYTSQDKDKKLVIKINENEIDWEQVIKFRDARLVVYNNDYVLKTTGSNYSELVGVLVNKSSADYETIKVKGIIRDTNGELIAASYQTMNTVFSGVKREFHIGFQKNFLDNDLKKEIQVETNILDADNYLKIRGTQDRWDQ